MVQAGATMTTIRPLALFLGLLLNVCNGVKILHHSIPRMVDCTNSTGVTLDCLYSYDPGDVKLVVRWFHNDSPEPIYQWIPEPDIRYVGQLIKPYFDMDFQVNNDRYSKYRALRLNSSTLPVTLSGNYSCVISSIANQDSRQGSMILYVPPKRFEFRFIETSHDQVALQCIAEGVYPKPRLSFSIRHQTNHSNYQQFPKVKVNVVASDRVLYSASFRHPIQSVLSAGTVYTCQLDLPGTTYIRKKRIKIIFPTSYATKPGQVGNAFSMSIFSHSPIPWNSSCCWRIVLLLTLCLLAVSIP